MREEAKEGVYTFWFNFRTFDVPCVVDVNSPRRRTCNLNNKVPLSGRLLPSCRNLSSSCHHNLWLELLPAPTTVGRNRCWVLLNSRLNRLIYEGDWSVHSCRGVDGRWIDCGGLDVLLEGLVEELGWVESVVWIRRWELPVRWKYIGISLLLLWMLLLRDLRLLLLLRLYRLYR